jgi:drug/metabolite transporter (DMT)-like permease
LSAVAVIGGSVAFVLFFDGLSQASSTQAAFVQKTLVVWVSILAVLVLHERVGLLQVAAVALLVLGQAMLAGPLTKVVTMPWGRGETEILVATLLWAVEVVIAKRLLAGTSSWTVAVARMAGGSVLLVGWLVVTGSFGILARLDGTQWAWVLLTGAMLAAYVAAWFAALARARAVDVTAVLVVAAPVTALLAASAQHVSLVPQLGGLLVLLAGAGVVLARMARPRTTVQALR